MHHDEFVEHCHVLGLSVTSHTAEQGGRDERARFWVAERLQVLHLARLLSSVTNVNHDLL